MLSNGRTGDGLRILTSQQAYNTIVSLSVCILDARDGAASGKIPLLVSSVGVPLPGDASRHVNRDDRVESSALAEYSVDTAAAKAFNEVCIIFIVLTFLDFQGFF